MCSYIFFRQGFIGVPAAAGGSENQQQVPLLALSHVFLQKQFLTNHRLEFIRTNSEGDVIKGAFVLIAEQRL